MSLGQNDALTPYPPCRSATAAEWSCGVASARQAVEAVVAGEPPRSRGKAARGGERVGQDCLTPERLGERRTREFSRERPIRFRSANRDLSWRSPSNRNAQLPREVLRRGRTEQNDSEQTAPIRDGNDTHCESAEP